MSSRDCNICGIHFEFPYLLERHINGKRKCKPKDSQDTINVCSYCKHNFATKYTLLNHIKICKKKKEEINISKAFEQSIRRMDRNFEYKKREMDKSWQYFVKSRDTFPEYMSKKLKNMPNNKGYIWKSIHFYGERPSIPGDPVILFETQREGILVIHEITNREYKIWHKKGTLKKFLHSSTLRSEKKVGLSSLENFIKIK